MPDKPATHESEELVSSDYVLRGRKLTVRVDTLRLADGAEAVREIVEHPGAVAIVPILDDGSVVLIRQWRHAAAGELLEIPAGTLEEGEEPIECARRELIEETGYEARTVAPVVSFYSSPGFTDEILHVFVARGLEPVGMDLDDGEIISPTIVPWPEAIAMCNDGRVRDAKTLIGLLMAERAV